MSSSSRLFRRSIPFVILIVSSTIFASDAITPPVNEDFNFAGLSDTVHVSEDQYGVPTIRGKSELDVAFVQGYIHARDRFFQMDYFRKVAQGRLSELVGSPALSNDVQLRTLGLARAALASWQSSDAETRGMLQSYANGVNTWLKNNPLPPEYTPLELTRVEPWTPHDSLSYFKLLAWDLSFDLDISSTIDLGTYQVVGQIVGFDGTALYFEDTNRSQPPDGRVTIPGFLGTIGGIGQSSTESVAASVKSASDENPAEPTLVPESTLLMAMNVQEKFRNSPLLSHVLTPAEKVKGSNEWAVSGVHTENGYPLVANDPHLALNTPATFHESNLVYDTGEGSYSVGGVQFPGAPGIIQGCNDLICWGSTVHPMDVTDVFQDTVELNAYGLPVATVHVDGTEPLTYAFQSFFINVVGDGVPDNIVRGNIGYDQGGISFISARRNNGPLLDFSGNSALFVQHTGWGPTQEPKFVLDMNRARNMDEFKAALQYFDFGSQNWIYGDVEGNIGYFTSGEKPLRADLASGTVGGGVPPWIIRDGSGVLNHEWLPVMNPQPQQSLRYEILPYSEMPQTVNPPWGYIANANNDPIGTTLDNNPLNQLRPGGNGIYYLNPGYADYRQGRVDRVLKELVESGEPVTAQDMMDLQANVELLDAELTLPTLLGIMSQVPVAPGSMMAQALDVLSTWDYSSPTGLAEGWDAGDDPTMAVEPDNDEVRNSAAATVFAMWRSMLVQNTIDATLTAVGLGDNLPGSTAAQRAFSYHLLNYGTNGGVGASGLNFFSAGLAETVAGSMQQALDQLASDEFAAAFGNSDNILDYRWGKLHRIVFDHPLNSDPFNIPNGGGFMDLDPNLPGLARQGGYQAVDASSHSARADSLNGFMFGSGPNRRFVGTMTPDGVDGHETIPGGQSGVFFHPNYSSQLPLWLTNSYHPLAVGADDGDAAAVVNYTFGPGQ
ncbi:MAG: penicillin acylase family protein [Xanthomonadales bacterium]|nr:penicillin acylase family protein [Xanthomonadales bacterium]